MMSGKSLDIAPIYRYPGWCRRSTRGGKGDWTLSPRPSSSPGWGMSLVRPGAWTRLGVVVTPGYAVLDSSQTPCEHMVIATLGNGDRLPCWVPPVPCSRCWGRFVSMVTTEMEYVFDRCRDRVWRCRIPADDDPCRGEWHRPVGSRIGAFGDAGAFVIETPRETLVVATHALWGGRGRMLRDRWSQVDVSTERHQLDEALEAGAVVRAEMFFRPRFFDHLFALGPDQWGVPLIERGLADLLEGVPA